MLYGAHEFSDVGKITGAVAAAQEKAEHRMQAFEQGKFTEIKQEIGDLKAMVSGKKRRCAARIAADTDDQPPTDTYRTTHCDDHCQPKKRKLVFWKVAATGLVVGLAAGALLAGRRIQACRNFVWAKRGASAKSTSGQYALHDDGHGRLFGASFGINRDAFRHVFDKTDLWFKGIVKSTRRGHRAGKSTSCRKKPCEKPAPPSPPSSMKTSIDYPQSDTFHRDRALAATGPQALLEFRPHQSSATPLMHRDLSQSVKH